MLEHTSLKQYLLFGAAGIIILALLLFGARERSEENMPAAAPASPVVFVSETEVAVEIADTPEKRAQGLSGKESLGENEGMLFVFETPGVYAFWMKDMRFPIDIIWIGDDLRVAHITHNAAPESFPETFQPPAPVRYVLEVNAGFAETHAVSASNSITPPDSSN